LRAARGPPPAASVLAYPGVPVDEREKYRRNNRAEAKPGVFARVATAYPPDFSLSNSARRMSSENPVDNLDCCETPALVSVMTVHESSHNEEALMQCRRCGRFWFYRFYEHVYYDGRDDEITTWYSPITDDEAKQIQQADGRPDLAFLSSRRSYIRDKYGFRKSMGQPTEPSV
jgi:hypothetical protein